MYNLESIRLAYSKNLSDLTELKLKTFNNGIIKIDEDGSLHVLSINNSYDIEYSLKQYEKILSLVQVYNSTINKILVDGYLSKIEEKKKQNMKWISVKDRCPEQGESCWAFGSDCGWITIENIRAESDLDKFDVYPCTYYCKEFQWFRDDGIVDPIKFVVWWLPREKDDDRSIYKNKYLPNQIKSRGDIPYEDILEVYDKD